MSDSNQLVIMSRPRTHWQAIDVGFRVARAHFFTLFVLWMGLSIPFFLLAEAINFMGGKYGLVLWWWFKPFYEVPLLFYLSKVVFSDTTTINQSWRWSIKKLGRSMMSFTGLSRFSHVRSTTAPIVLLENQSGAKRRSRAQVLTADTNRAFVLLIGCVHLELFLGYLLLGLIAFFFPDRFVNVMPEFMAGEIPVGIQTMLNIAVVIAAGLMAPFYVGAGFLIYINRRMRLEAWDIEHQFKSISAQHNSKPKFGSAKASALLLATMLIWQLPTEHAIADDSLQTAELTPSAAKESINSILSHRDFGGTETRRVPTFWNKHDDSEHDLEGVPEFIGAIASILEYSLWIVAILALILIAQFIFKFKPDLNLNRSTRPRKLTDLKSAEHHPLTQTLPDNITQQAQQLLDSGNNRGALSLLFRGALRALMQQHKVEISAGATEADCVTTLQAHANSTQMSAFSRLVSNWQQEAYAHIPLHNDDVLKLIQGWNENFRPNPEREI